MKFSITLKDSATYEFNTDNITVEKAKEKALDWFSERKPEITVDTKHIHCPVHAWDCPYFGKHNICTMYPDFDPNYECDDFYYFWGDDDSMDYICYEEH